MDYRHTIKKSDLTDVYKYLSYMSESRSNQDLAILVDTSRYHLLDRIESLFDQVGILDPENHYRISVRTFLKNILDGNAGDTCIGLEPITIDLLPSLRFHCDHDGDIGIHHPLTENEITQHSNSLDISCPIGRKSICHYSDFVSYISTNLNVELSRAKSKFFRKQLRQLLNIPQPIRINYPTVVRTPEDIPITTHILLTIAHHINY